MITCIELKNYRAIDSETIDLGKLTLLVGRNGAGKSTVVDALKFVRDALVNGVDDALLVRHGISSLRRWSPTRPYDVEINLTLAGARIYGKYGMILASGKDGAVRVKREFGTISNSPSEEPDVFERSAEKWLKLPESGTSRMTSRMNATPLDPLALALPSVAIFSMPFTRLRTFLKSMCFYSIFPNTLREPQKPSASQVLDDHGANLAAVARAIRTADRPRLVTALNSVVGGVTDFRVEPVAGYLVTQLQRRVADDRLTWFDLSQESDGTLRMLGLLVALYQASPPRFIAIEEPELTLHPGALGFLGDILLEASTARQLLLTTQSPDLITRFPVDSLRVVERMDGVSHVGPISETQRRAISEQLFTSGDLLRLEGLRR